MNKALSANEIQEEGGNEYSNADQDFFPVMTKKKAEMRGEFAVQSGLHGTGFFAETRARWGNLQKGRGRVSQRFRWGLRFFWIIMNFHHRHRFRGIAQLDAGRFREALPVQPGQERVAHFGFQNMCIIHIPLVKQLHPFSPNHRGVGRQIAEPDDFTGGVDVHFMQQAGRGQQADGEQVGSVGFQFLRILHHVADVFPGGEAAHAGRQRFRFVRQQEMRALGLGEAGSPMFLNTVLWHEAADYSPFYFSGTDIGRLGIASCVIKGFTPATSTGYGFRYDVLDADPVFAAKEAASGILSTPKLTGHSPAMARRGAVKVCPATNGQLYFLDTHKAPNVWRKLTPISETSSLSLADGATIGLDTAGAPFPDIFGNARGDRAPIGPYAFCPSPATVLEAR